MAKNQLRIGAAMSYVSMAVGALIPMFYTPVMLKLLGQNEYGLYKLATTITTYLSLISFGIGSAVVRYLIKFRADEDTIGEQKMFGLFNVIFMVISVTALLLGVLLAFNINLFYSQSLDNSQISELRVLVLLLSLTTAINLLSTPYNSVVTCHERFIFLQFVNFLTTVVPPVLYLIVLYLGFASIGMVSVSLFFTVVTRVVYCIYVRKSICIKPIYHEMPIHLLKEVLTFSFWVFVATVVNQLYNATDTVIIGSVPALATKGVAVYNIGVTFTNMMNSFTQGIGSVLTPKINVMVFKDASNTELTDAVIRFGRLQCYIVAIVCGGFITFGKQFIRLWAGPDYGEAYWVCLCTMIPICIPLIQNVALSIVVAQNKHRFRSIVYLGIAIINVVGTILCVNNFGIIGAAFVSGIAYVIGTGIIMNWYYWKEIGLEIPRYWKSIANIFIIPLIMTIIGLFVLKFISLNKWIPLLGGIFIYTVIFAVVNWFFVMNDYEKDIFRVPVIKAMKRIKKMGDVK